MQENTVRTFLSFVRAHVAERDVCGGVEIPIVLSAGSPFDTVLEMGLQEIDSYESVP